MSTNPLLFPNIAGAPGGVPLTKEPVQAPDRSADGKVMPASEGPDFQTLLNKSIKGPSENQDRVSDSIQIPLKISAHAHSRILSRGIDLGPEQMRKISGAVDKAAAKGLDDTLILTKDAAFIVSVRNRTVVTAMDRSQLEGNVFTNIEGAVVV